MTEEIAKKKEELVEAIRAEINTALHLILDNPENFSKFIHALTNRMGTDLFDLLGESTRDLIEEYKSLKPIDVKPILRAAK